MNPRLHKRAVNLVDLPTTLCYVSPPHGLQSSVHGGCGHQPDVGAMMSPKSSNTFYFIYNTFYLLTIHPIGMKVKRLTSKLLNVYKNISSYIKWYQSLGQLAALYSSSSSLIF